MADKVDAAAMRAAERWYGQKSDSEIVLVLLASVITEAYAPAMEALCQCIHWLDNSGDFLRKDSTAETLHEVVTRAHDALKEVRGE